MRVYVGGERKADGMWWVWTDLEWIWEGIGYGLGEGGCSCGGWVSIFRVWYVELHVHECGTVLYSNVYSIFAW